MCVSVYQYPCTSSWVCVPVAPIEDTAMFYPDPLPPPADEKYEPSWVSEKKGSKDEKYEYDPCGDNNGYIWNDQDQEWVYQYPPQQGEAKTDVNYNYDNTYYDSQTGEAVHQENGYYFYNTFSAQAVWFEPVGWEDVVALDWNGWWLCREELTGVEYW